MHPQIPSLTIGRTVLKESDDLVILGVTFDSKMIFEKIALFPEQLLNGLVSWGNPGKYSMIDYFLGDALWVLSCLFWNTALQCVVRLLIHTSNSWTVLSVVPFFVTRGVFECAHRRSVYRCMLNKIRCNPLHPLYSVLPVAYVPVHIGSLMHLFAAEHRSIA